MRKYQQLLLLVVSFCSISILLIYKSENSRLKYVLQVVNFFGRNDSIILNHIDTLDLTQEQYDFPLPLWQSIGNGFHVYSTYWNRNELVAGGEAIALVAAKRGAVLNFRCALLYDGGARSIQGKFHFSKNDLVETADTQFSQYKFYCRLTRDFGNPEMAVFVGGETKTAHKLKLRYVKRNGSPQLATICVNLFNYNASSTFGHKDSNVVQFFVHHKMLGIEHFIVYSSDELSRSMLRLIRNKGVHLELLPFNFPFVSQNATERSIIEADCILRNTNLARHTILLEPNEFIYSNAKFASNQSIFNHNRTEDFNRFQLRTFAVCINRNNNLLVDNNMYDPEVRAQHEIYINRLHMPISNTLDKASTRDLSLTVSEAFVHRYIHCVHIGKDGLHDWRNSIRADFMQKIHAERNEIGALIS